MTGFKKISGIITRFHLPAISVWATSLLGIFLLIDTVKSTVHIILLVLTALVLLLCRMYRQHRAARVTVRLLCGLPIVAALVAFIPDMVRMLQEGATLLQALQPMCIIGTPLLCWLLLALFAVARDDGRYDRWMLRVGYLWLVVLVAIACCTAMRQVLVWYTSSPVLQGIWLAFAVVGTVLCWLPIPLKQEKTAEQSLRR